MQVYLICSHVDLGYHVEAVHADQAVANKRCKEMNASARAKKIEDLMKYCNYTRENAEEMCAVEQYFVEAHVVE